MHLLLNEFDWRVGYFNMPDQGKACFNYKIDAKVIYFFNYTPEPQSPALQLSTSQANFERFPPELTDPAEADGEGLGGGKAGDAREARDAGDGGQAQGQGARRRGERRVHLHNRLDTLSYPYCPLPDPHRQSCIRHLRYVCWVSLRKHYVDGPMARLECVKYF